jgi:glycosyltransferase involved in cell wall biosynthesis
VSAAGSPPGTARRATLSVTVLTRDEEHNLPRCLASVAGLADQVVVVDSGSTDHTLEIARAAGAEVVERPFPGWIAQYQFALELARGDWVLALDADEWLSPALRAALAPALAGARPEVNGFELERRAFVFGAWVRHGGWTEWKLRLARRGKAHWGGVDPHPSLRCDGGVARLRGALCHRPYADLGHHLAKQDRYAAVYARGIAASGRPPSLLGLLGEPPAVFLQRLFLQGGWRDGVRGVALAGMAATYFFLRHARRWEVFWSAARRAEPGADDSPPN